LIIIKLLFFIAKKNIIFVLRQTNFLFGVSFATNKIIEVTADNTSQILERRADFQAAIAAPIANTTNNGLKSGKNGKPPLLGSASYAFKDSGGDALHFGTVINSLKT
jgi:hypothetical protein